MLFKETKNAKIVTIPEPWFHGLGVTRENLNEKSTLLSGPISFSNYFPYLLKKCCSVFDLPEHLSGEVTRVFFLWFLTTLERIVPMLYLKYINFIGLLALKSRFRVLLVYTLSK